MRVLLLVLCCGLLALRASGATPSFTLKASNVSVSDQGSGVSNFTITSVNGFSGEVGVVCTGPNPIIVPDLILPVCTVATVNFQVPAGGSVKGTMNFVPPPSVESSSNEIRERQRRPGNRQLPFEGGAMAAVVLVGWGLRRTLNKRIAMLVLGVASLIASAILSGCSGNGGLAMTPGTYSDEVSGVSASATVNTTIQVTVR
jgi:hypothetical protein